MSCSANGHEYAGIALMLWRFVGSLWALSNYGIPSTPAIKFDSITPTVYITFDECHATLYRIELSIN